ncbi:unnamed protein product [Brassica oleracea]
MSQVLNPANTNLILLKENENNNSGYLKQCRKQMFLNRSKAVLLQVHYIFNTLQNHI